MITPMARVEIVCLNSIRTELVESLQAAGLLHLEDVPLLVDEAPAFLHRIQLEGDQHENLVRLEELQRSLNEVVPLLTRIPSSKEVALAVGEFEAMPEAEWPEQLPGLIEGLRALTREKASIQDMLAVLGNYKKILEDIAPTVGGDTKLGKGSRALVLTGDVKGAVARLEERFREDIGPECRFHSHQTSRRNVVGLVTYPEAKDEHVTRILNQEGVTTVDIRDEEYADASVGEVITRIDANMSKQAGALRTIEGKLSKTSAEVGARLLGLKAMVTDSLSQLQVQQRFAASEMITVITGWTPTDRFAELESAVDKAFPGEVEVNRIGFDEMAPTDVPTQLRNPGVFRPFEVILRLFQPPTYGTVDPTIMVAISFILFYGFIVGDVVYGAAVIAFAMWLGRKWGHIEAVAASRTIGIYMGISTMVFGVIYGEYCGEVFAAKFGIPILFHRGHETTQLLKITLYAGIVHVLIAMVLGVKEHLRHGHTKHAVERLGMLLGLIALIVACFGYFDFLFFGHAFFTYFAAVSFGVGAVMIFWAVGPMMGAVGVLEIMSLGGNIMSYARLMALGVAAIAIAGIANDLPSTMGPWLGIPMAILVHLANIGISIASPTIHSLRLNFVEFLPKFYSPEGKGFNPFKKETQT